MPTPIKVAKVAPEAVIVCANCLIAPLGPAPLRMMEKLPKMKP